MGILGLGMSGIMECEDQEHAYSGSDATSVLHSVQRRIFQLPVAGFAVDALPQKGVERGLTVPVSISACGC